MASRRISTKIGEVLMDCDECKGTSVTDKRIKVTDEQVIEIRRAYKPGVVGYKRLAKKYGVDPITIRKIVRMETRKGVL